TVGARVEGNRIGTNAAGTAALGNRTGVSVAGSNNTVGGAAPGAGNVIAGGRNHGVELLAVSGKNLAQGNYISTDVTGTRALGNTNGVEVRGPNNTVAGNLIAGNRNYGVFLASTGATDNGVLGNLIGTDATGTAALGNRAGVVVTGPNNRIGGTE